MEKRTTKPNNKFYNTTSKGGYSQCIVGKPTDKNANVLSNCVGYACGRFNEIIGEMKYPYLNCNAENFIERAKKYYNLKIVDYPTLGGIMVWQKGNTLKVNDGAGHVEIVEEIINKNTILTSASNYGGTAFYNAKRSNSNGRWGLTSGYTFRGCIINPAIGDIHFEEQERVEEILKSDNNEEWIPKIGDKVHVVKTGKATSYGEYNTAKANYDGVITNDLSNKNRKYPYLVSVNGVCIGWYQQDALKKI